MLLQNFNYVFLRNFLACFCVFFGNPRPVRILGLSDLNTHVFIIMFSGLVCLGGPGPCSFAVVEVGAAGEFRAPYSNVLHWV